MILLESRTNKYYYKPIDMFCFIAQLTCFVLVCCTKY